MKKGIVFYWEAMVNNEEMRELTGRVTGGSLDAFFYTLLRDHLPAGVVEKIVDKTHGITEAEFTNGHLANCAKLLAARLVPESLARENK